MVQVIPLSSPTAFNLLDATVAEINQALEFGALTSEQLVQLYLNRITAYDFNAPVGEGAQPLNTILALNENVLASARGLDEERRQGNVKSLLHGIPVLLKDNIDTADQPTTAGSVALAGSVPPDDAFITSNLRDAGAVILGKASLTEYANYLANGMPAGYSSLNGYTFNPYNPTLSTTIPDGRPALSPGGSSAGSAAAVAASLVPVSIGSETNGSILSPGNQNSVVGIKPTVGLISRDGIIPIAASQDTAGPFGKTVADAATLLGLLTGVDPNDGATSSSEGKAFTDYTQFLDDQALQGKRIGVPKTVFWDGITDEQRGIVERSIAVLQAQGATIVYEDIPTAQELATTSNIPVLDYEFKRDLNAYLRSLGADAPVKSLAEVIAFNAANPEVALKYGQARALSAESKDLSPSSADTIAYLTARSNDLRLTKDAIDAYLGTNDLDAVLFPATRGGNIGARAGYPSIILPAGYLANSTPTQADDAPYGIALLGTAYSEPTLIGFGYDYEQAAQVRVAPASTPGLPGETFQYLKDVLVVGTEGDDAIVPQAVVDFDGNGDTVYALGGSDTIDTGSGVSGGNQIFAGEGDDSITVSRNDVVTGGSGNDTFITRANSGINTITDFGGLGRGSSPSAQTIDRADTLKFVGAGFTARNLQLMQQGSDLLISFAGFNQPRVVLQNFALENIDNLLQATRGTIDFANILFNGETQPSDSFDVFNADSDRTTLFNFNTVTFLNNSDNTVIGYDDSNDVINAQGGNDRISGLSGDDVLRGGAGDDLLTGGLEADELTGGEGRDRFVLALDGSIDVVTDFAIGLDLLQLTGGLTVESIAIAQGTQGTILSVGGQSLAVLIGISASNLSSSDFTAG